MRSIIYTIIATTLSIHHLIAAPNLVGEWITTYGRYSDTTTYKADGTYVTVTEIVRGPAANQDNATKSSGTWKLNGEELVHTKEGKSYKTKIRFVSPTSFEEPSEFGRNGVLIYEKSQSVKNSEKPANVKITYPKIGSPERKLFMDTMREPVSKYARTEIIFTGDVAILGDWAKLGGKVSPKNGKPFAEDIIDEVEQDFLAIFEKIDGVWKLGYFGWSSDIYTLTQAHKNHPNLPEALVPNFQEPNVDQLAPRGRLAFIDGESNFRAGPSAKSAVKFQPHRGTIGTLLERSGKWIKLELENGDSGWAHESNLKSVN